MPKTIFIKFFAGVDGNSANTLMSLIDDKLKNGYNKIVLLISSPGGTVFHGLSLHNYLVGIPAEVETHNFGSVDSIGVVIYCAGKKRYSVPDARFLLHAVSTGFSANTRMEEKQIEEILKSLRIDNENIAAVVANNTGKTEAEIVQAMADRTTLSPEQAKTFGLVHEIKSELFPVGTEVVAINMS
jgi:ATP-dependent Clp protease protease subunit